MKDSAQKILHQSCRAGARHRRIVRCSGHIPYTVALAYQRLAVFTLIGLSRIRARRDPGARRGEKASAL
jgi:hypothetical protein